MDENDGFVLTVRIIPPAGQANGETSISADVPLIARHSPRKEVSSSEALSISVSTFIEALAEHLDREFEETEQLFCGVAFNLWGAVDSPEGWTAMALLLSPPDADLPLLIPTIH